MQIIVHNFIKNIILPYPHNPYSSLTCFRVFPCSFFVLYRFDG